MNSNSAIHPWGFLKTLLISYGLTVILLLGLTFLVYSMKWSASQTGWGIMVIYALSCGVGGFLTGKRMGNRRLLWGLLSGVLYFLVLLVLSVLAGGMPEALSRIFKALAACLAGSIVGAFAS